MYVTENVKTVTAEYNQKKHRTVPFIPVITISTVGKSSLIRLVAGSFHTRGRMRCLRGDKM